MAAAIPSEYPSRGGFRGNAALQDLIFAKSLENKFKEFLQLVKRVYVSFTHMAL
jgi:hypothetical protein